MDRSLAKSWRPRLLAKQSGGQLDYIDDAEFGKIRLIRNDGRYLRLNIRTNGEIVISAPRWTNDTKINSFLNESRDHVRRNLAKLNNRRQFQNGDMIGRHHQLVIQPSVRPDIKLTGSQVVVRIPDDYTDIQRTQLIHQGVAKALKSEASRYLPKRLRALALQHGYSYDKVRLTFAKSRWGSCSTSGTISLNVSLMLLPEELSDYVLLHELTHTHHMNHSQNFWNELSRNLPNARALSRQLRDYSPYI